MSIFSSIGSSIGSFLSSACSAVCSCVGRICSGIAGALGGTALGGAISSFVTKIGVVIPGLDIISAVFMMIDCQVKCNTIREKIFEAPRRESGN